MAEADAPTLSAKDIAPPPEVLGQEIVIVFTDIERSTALARYAGPAWPQILHSCHEAVRSPFGEQGGFEAGNQGDGLLYLFASFDGTLQAILEAFAALRGDRERSGEAKIRMGVHVGTVSFSSEIGFYGLDIHRASRVASAANGEQVLLSKVAAERAKASTIDGVHVTDHGLFHLKDFPQPEDISELDVGGESLPVRARSVASGELPASAGRLVGRDAELHELDELVQYGTAGEVITLSGAGGVGKTRLASAYLELHGSRASHFVDFSQVEDPALVLPEIARVLVLGLDTAPTVDRVAEALDAQGSILVLDNLEQIIDAATEIATLARQAQQAKIIVTSRAELRIANEHVIDVRPLKTGRSGVGDLSPAVALFLELAEDQLGPDPLDDASLRLIGDICRALDGLPLAIELAVGRLNVLTLTDLAEQVSKSLVAVLVNGRRDGPIHHRAVTTAIQRSYDMVSADAQLLFRRLGMLPAGATIETLSNLSGLERGEVANATAELVDHRLVTPSDGRTGNRRFTMLRILREVAASFDSGEQASARHVVVDFYHDLAQRAAVDFQSSKYDETFRLLEDEAENFRTIFDWTEDDPELLDPMLKAAANLMPFWWQTNVESGMEQLRRLTDRKAAVDQPSYPHALIRMSMLASYGGGAGEAIRLARLGVSACRRSGRSGRTLSSGLQLLGAAYSARGKRQAALAAIYESLAIDRGLAPMERAVHLVNNGNVLLAEDNWRQALELYNESLSIFEDAEVSWMRAAPLARLGDVSIRRGYPGQATTLLTDSLALWESGPGVGGRARAQAGLARARWCTGGHNDDAMALAIDAFNWAHGIRAHGELPWSVIVIAACLSTNGEHEQAARLFGAGSAMATAFSQPVHGCLNNDLSQSVALIKSVLGPERVDELWADGEEWTVGDAANVIAGL